MDGKQDPQESEERRKTLGRQAAMRVAYVPLEGFIAVYEEDAGTEGRILVFDSMLGRQQLRDYPANWQRLSDGELFALRRRAD